MRVPNGSSVMPQEAGTKVELPTVLKIRSNSVKTTVVPVTTVNIKSSRRQ